MDMYVNVWWRVGQLVKIGVLSEFSRVYLPPPINIYISLSHFKRSQTSQSKVESQAKIHRCAYVVICCTFLLANPMRANHMH